jgi:Fe2+ or Zn2+ uptake regulation protein
MKDRAQLLENTLKKHGYSVTRVRRLVFTALDKQAPQTMSELISRLTPGIDRASAYRTVSLFENIGIVQRLQIGWKYKLELSDEFTDHHHHISCVKCGQLQSFHENEEFVRILEQSAKRSGYTLVHHQVDLQGICKKCQKT